MADKKKTPMEQLEESMTKAREALATASAEDRAALESSIAEGQKTLEAAKAEGMSDEDKAAVEKQVAELVAGAKTRDDARKALIDTQVNEIVTRKLAEAGLGENTTVADAVKSALSARSGSKALMEYSENQQTIYTPSAPAHLRHAQGDKANRGRLILAIGRKALGLCSEAEIIDIQRAMGVEAGFKSLAEGGGAESAISGPGGGYLVPPEYNTQIIEYLYARNVLRAAGVPVVPMKGLIYKEPRRASTSTAAGVGELQAMPSSKPGYSQLVLTAKKRTVFVAISRELVEDSDPSVEVDVRTDMGEELGLFEDYDMLLGVSSAVNSAGILTAAAGATVIGPSATAPASDAVSFEVLVDIRTRMNADNVPARNRFWICNPYITGELAKVKSPGNNYVFADNAFSIPNSSFVSGLPANRKAPVGTLLGWPVYESTQIPNNAAGAAGYGGVVFTATAGILALVEGSEVKIGQRGDILMDASREGTYVDSNGQVQSAYQNDEILYRGIVRSDVGLRHGVGVVVRQGLTISALA